MPAVIAAAGGGGDARKAWFRVIPDQVGVARKWVGESVLGEVQEH
jgi:hypothetical protein